MHLFILGSTGKTGVYAYKYALDQGYHVTIIVRSGAEIDKHENLTIVEGSVLSEEDMDRAFKAAGTPIDSVLVFLNSRRQGDNPWGKFLGPKRLIADSTANATRALRQQSRQADAPKPRLVVLNALGVGESRVVTPYLIRFIIDWSNVGKTYEDHHAVDTEIEQNCGEDVAWTVTLAVGLTGDGVTPVKTFGPTEAGASYFITRESCARWMIDVASGKLEDEFTNKRVIVSN